jgi:hypothetical protein
MPPHPYKPLGEGEIRVLRLRPGGKDEPLLGSLQHVMLGVGNYQAISYAWGEPVFNRSIDVDSEEFRITDSLFGALHRFRDPDEDVSLWADQLCINQSDLDEKNVQVAIMAKIFGRAHKVRVWLGGPEEHHDTAFAMMYFLVNDWWSSGLLKDLPLPKVRHMWKDHNPNVTLEEGLVAFSTIARKAWFERLWVVQELLAACRRDVSFYCGQDSIPCFTAIKAFQHFNEFVKFEGLPFDVNREERVADLYDPGFFKEETSRAPRFLKVLFETSHLKAAEPRDRVFALMAVANIVDVKVNYAIGLPDLWRLVARFLLKGPSIDSMRSLVLALPTTQCDTAEVSSSWSTDFNALTLESQRKRTWYSKEGYLNHAGGHASSGATTVPQSQEADVCLWRGVVIDQVDRILEGSDIPVLPSTLSSSEDLVEPACRLLYQYSAYLKVARQVVPSLGRHDFNCVFRQGTRQPNRRRYRQSLANALEIVLERNLVSVSSEENMSNIVNDLCDLCLTDGLSYMDHSRLLASTTKGLLGWVPKHAKVGDHICLLQGFPAPFIVRELDDGYYAIVGDAYIQGIMEGENWPEDDSEIATIKIK